MKDDVILVFFVMLAGFGGWVLGKQVSKYVVARTGVKIETGNPASAGRS